MNKKRITGQTLFGLAGLLAVSSMGVLTSHIKPFGEKTFFKNPYENSPIVVEYQNNNLDLSYLQNARQNINNISLPCYNEKFNSNKLDSQKNLDAMINYTQNKKETLKQNSVVASSIKWEQNFLYYGIGGAEMIAVGMLIGSGFLLREKDKKVKSDYPPILIQ
ncbi:MAG: hypothetical protein WC584_01590 [Candidatus Pacearchaeota archaeon]